MENSDYEQLVKETRAKVLLYADAQDWQVVKKTVSYTLTLSQTLAL